MKKTYEIYFLDGESGVIGASEWEYGLVTPTVVHFFIIEDDQKKIIASFVLNNISGFREQQ